MKIEIKSMDISNFKGIHSLHLDFQSGRNSLYGNNGVGKSSVYDALTWVLFGKDSKGNSQFSVKPANAPQGTMPDVIVILLVDGEELKLRKTLREKWEKHRGSANARFAGHTTDYTVDDVPRKESEYKRIISGYIDEKRFKLLTNVFAFTPELHWKERRALLAEVCGLPDDSVLLANEPQFAELSAALGRRTVDEYKAVLLEQRKGINTTLNTLPVRIDECERMVADLAGLPFAEAHTTAEVLQAERASIQADIAKLEGDALLAQAKNEKREMELEMQALDAENQKHRDSQNLPIEDRTAELEREHQQSVQAYESVRTERDRLRQRIADGNNRLEEYRCLWHEINRETFSGATCPTCGQSLPPEEQDAARRKWETDQKGRKNRLLSDSNLIKGDISTLQARQQETERELPVLKQKVEAATEAVRSYIPPTLPVIKDLPDYARRAEAIQRALEDANRRIERLSYSQQEERDKLEEAFKVVNIKILENDVVLGKEQQLMDTRRRIAELQEEQKKYAAQVEELTRLIDMCQEFTRYRVSMVENSVNTRFKIARFRLFTEQVNGGLEDCCDVVVNNVPYNDINDAMKVNVGLDIIDTLSEYYGVRVPLFVDNAEGITELNEIGTQIVRLVVSEQDKELRLA